MGLEKVRRVTVTYPTCGSDARTQYLSAPEHAISDVEQGFIQPVALQAKPMTIGAPCF